MTEFLTFGHGTLERPALAELLRGAGVVRLVDVRRFPGSRRNLDVARDALPAWLPEEGIEYTWLEELGGRRRLPAGEVSRDTWWQVEMFRAYATYTRTDEFGQGLDTLAALADDAASPGQGRIAIMCSETVWWRCHRRIVADVAVLGRGYSVSHLMHDGRLTPHPVSPGARLGDGRTTGDGGPDRLMWPGEDPAPE